MHEMRVPRRILVPWLAGAVAFSCACTPNISTRRETPLRPSLGEQLYGVFCDRVGAQSLHDDLTGSSYQGLCHRKDGLFADKVDARFLPSIQGGATRDGQAISAEQQQRDRAHAMARIEALARRRGDLIPALDAMLPDIQVTGKDLKNPNLIQSCNSISQEQFRDQLSDLLNRLQGNKLYLDGTLPDSTQSMGRLFSAFASNADLQSALARLESRKGYRPADVSLGVIQPLLAYPGLRDLNNSALTLISPDANPYDPNPARDSTGRRVPVPGTEYPQLTKLIEVGHHELRTATADPPTDRLIITRDAALGRDVLSRPRSTAEMLQQLLLVEDPLLGRGSPRYIVRRDQRGVAKVALVNGAVPPPFVDKNGEADIDELGRFKTLDDKPASTPFPSPDEQSGTSRDSFGRATAIDGRLIYEYIDTSHTFAAALLDDLKPLVNPDLSQNHETLMDSLAGLLPLFGSRRPADKTYPADATEGATTVHYSRFPGNFPADPPSPVLDLAHAAGQLLDDPTIDDTLALTRKLFAEHPNDLARLVGAMLEAKKIADRHPEAQLSRTSTFWDELIRELVKIVQVPAVPGQRSLLEDILIALAADDGVPFREVLSAQMGNKDLISYDRLNINAQPFSYDPGPSGDVDLTTRRIFSRWWVEVERALPATGTNRSFFQRYLQLIHDTNGVAACNAEGGRLFLQGICDPSFGCIDLEFPGAPQPDTPGAKECELYKIKNLAEFYLDSIVGAAQILLRPRFGGPRGLQSPEVFFNSSGLNSLWPTPRGDFLRPRPEFLNRLVFFDFFRDSPLPGGINHKTSCFISALNGPFLVAPRSNNHLCEEDPPPQFPPDDFKGGTGSIVCDERTITDPYRLFAPPLNCPGQFCPEDAEPPDYQISGLRNCKNGQWLSQRDNNVLFAFEQPLQFPNGTSGTAYRALTPVVSAFVSHGQEQRFLSLIEVLHRHWQYNQHSLEECDSSKPPTHPLFCTEDGLVRSEAMLAEIFGETDLLPAFNNLNKILRNTTIQHCETIDPQTQRCMSSTPMDGIAVMANAARKLLDPASNMGLTDRRGNRTTTWNDRSTILPQLTPLYLLTNALRSVDDVFDASPGNRNLRVRWQRARSQLVDQFLGVEGTGSSARFSRPGLPRVVITSTDAIRSQLLAKCPGTVAPPYTARCGWARDEILSNLLDSLTGPLFAAVQDFAEALRNDERARVETEKLLSHLFGAPADVPGDTGRAGLLSSMGDAVQIASDQTNFIPILHALAPAVSVSGADAGGAKGLIDAQLTLLTRASGQAFNPAHEELCASEVDPNQVVTAVLKRASIPVSINGKVPQAPLEVMLDVIADVNRVSPEQTDKLHASDYASIFDQVADFMLSAEHGLEQFYEIVRQGTVQ